MVRRNDHELSISIAVIGKTADISAVGREVSHLDKAGLLDAMHGASRDEQKLLPSLLNHGHASGDAPNRWPHRNWSSRIGQT
jgi:hypothetical protein